jgi:hypothetical protein
MRCNAANSTLKYWFPAFAGMTNLCAGTTQEV